MRSKRADASGKPVFRHPLPVRLMHWLNVIIFPIMLMSGFNIFNAHSELNWGKSSYDGSPPVLAMKAWVKENGELMGTTSVFGHRFDTTGFLGVSQNREGKMSVRGFPSWLTLPGTQWLAMARRWHFLFAWLLLANGLAFWLYAFMSGHLRRDLLPAKGEWSTVGKTLKDHLLLRRPKGEEAKNYNVLQKTSYLSVIFVLFPLVALNGLAMSPALNSIGAGWVDILGGRQAARTIHFIVSFALVAFIAVHVFQVIVTGFWNNLRSMITGYYRIESEDK